MTWNDTFTALFDRCVATYQSGDHDFEKYYTSIGHKPREFFDFIEDFCEEATPSLSTAVLIAAARRDYFVTVQKSAMSNKVVKVDDLPSFGEELEGMAYLPRILAKGRAKLRGELDPDIMFGCGGDRNFMKNHGELHPADFLRNLWAAGDDDQKIAAWIKAQQMWILFSRNRPLGKA
jgi:hypothetical protein